MNFFAGLFLLFMPEENAFWALVGVIDDYFDGYYTEEMIESQVDQLVLEEVVRERFHKLGVSSNYITDIRISQHSLFVKIKNQNMSASPLLFF